MSDPARRIVISTTPTTRGRPTWVDDRIRSRRALARRRWWDPATDDGPGIFLPWRQIVFRLAGIAVSIGVFALLDAVR